MTPTNKMSELFPQATSSSIAVLPLPASDHVRKFGPYTSSPLIASHLISSLSVRSSRSRTLVPSLIFALKPLTPSHLSIHPLQPTKPLTSSPSIPPSTRSSHSRPLVLNSLKPIHPSLKPRDLPPVHPTSEIVPHVPTPHISQRPYSYSSLYL